jgi:hypothetical protein
MTNRYLQKLQQRMLNLVNVHAVKKLLRVSETNSNGIRP